MPAPQPGGTKRNLRATTSAFTDDKMRAIAAETGKDLNRVVNELLRIGIERRRPEDGLGMPALDPRIRT